MFNTTVEIEIHGIKLLFKKKSNSDTVYVFNPELSDKTPVDKFTNGTIGKSEGRLREACILYIEKKHRIRIF